MLGPDVSHHQSKTDFAALAKDSRFRFAILKATEGRTYVDPTFNTRLGKVLRARLLAGAYHFGTGSDPKHQAGHFIRTVEAANGNSVNGVLLILDWERNPSKEKDATTMTEAQARTFMDGVRELLPGCKVGLYASASWMKGLGQDFSWVAAYGRKVFPKTTPPSILWQYTNGKTNGTTHPSSAPGIGHCDISVTDLDESELRAYAAGVAPEKYFAVVSRRDGREIAHARSMEEHLDQVRKLYAAGERDYNVKFE